MCTFKKGPKMRFIKPLSPCYKVRHVKDDDVILRTTHDYKIAASGKKNDTQTFALFLYFDSFRSFLM